MNINTKFMFCPHFGVMDIYPHFDVMDIIYFDKNMDKKQKLFKFKSLIFMKKPKEKKKKRKKKVLNKNNIFETLTNK